MWAKACGLMKWVLDSQFECQGFKSQPVIDENSDIAIPSSISILAQLIKINGRQIRVAKWGSSIKY